MQHNAQTTHYALPGDRAFPESIGYNPVNGDFFVGSLADGQVLRGNVGDEAVTEFLPAGGDGRGSAAGIKVDARGRLFVGGGPGGKVWIYDIATRRHIATLSSGAAVTLINDIAILPGGEAYVTDSLHPVLYRIAADATGEAWLEEWLPFAGTPLTYFRAGLNLNGIAPSADGTYLLVNQTNAGLLFRIEIATKTVRTIDLGGRIDEGQPIVQTLPHGDGILLDGQRLFVARNTSNEIAIVDLTPDLLRGEVTARLSPTELVFPTGLAKAGDRLLVTNAQLNRMGPGSEPDLPFTVVSMPLPA